MLGGLVCVAMKKKRALKVEDIPAKMSIAGAKPYKPKAANPCISEPTASILTEATRALLKVAGGDGGAKLIWFQFEHV
jgi:hypothetical protein